MFDFLKNAQRVSDLTTQNTMLKTQIENLKGEIEKLQTRENTALAEFAIDFDKMDVFSVERNGDKHEPCTIIGHFFTSPDKREVREWYLYCSPLTHAKLVKEFEEHKLKGTNGTK